MCNGEGEKRNENETKVNPKSNIWDWMDSPPRQPFWIFSIPTSYRVKFIRWSGKQQSHSENGVLYFDFNQSVKRKYSNSRRVLSSFLESPNFWTRDTYLVANVLNIQVQHLVLPDDHLKYPNICKCTRPFRCHVCETLCYPFFFFLNTPKKFNSSHKLKKKRKNLNVFKLSRTIFILSSIRILLYNCFNKF